MKALYRNLLIIIISLIAVDFFIGFLFAKASDRALERSPNAMKTEYTIKEVDADVLIFGSSRANHHYVPDILEEDFGLSVYNCGKDGLPFYYSAAMFNAVTQRYSPKMIIIDIEPMFLEEDYNDYSRAYELLPFYYKNKLFREISNKRSFFEPVKALSSMYRYNSRFIAIFSKLIIDDYKFDRGYSPLANSGYKYPDKLSFTKYDKDVEIDSFTDYLLDRTIETAKENNTILVFSISPRYQNSNIEEVESWNYLRAKLERLDNVHLIDNGDITLVSDSTLYKDGAHLNDNGARVFTKYIVEELSRSFEL